MGGIVFALLTGFLLGGWIVPRYVEAWLRWKVPDFARSLWGACLALVLLAWPTMACAQIQSPSSLTAQSYPNKPAGLSRMIVYTPFDRVPGLYPYHQVPGWTGKFGQNPSWNGRGSDAANGVADYWSTTWPNAAMGGKGYSWLTAWDNSTATFDTIYVSHRLRIRGPKYEQNAVMTKWEWLQTASRSANYNFLAFLGQPIPSGAPGGLVTAGRIAFRQQGPVAGQSNRNQNVTSAPVFTVGSWHQLEYVATINSASCTPATNRYSSGPATIYLSNGTLTVWVDGVKVMTYADICWRIPGSSTQGLGFWEWKWNPTWGGGGGPRFQDDFADHDELAVFTH